MPDPVAYGCPECGSLESRVLDTRMHRHYIRRRRVCGYGHRYTTREYVQAPRGRWGNRGFPDRIKPSMDGLGDAVGDAVLAFGAHQRLRPTPR